LWAPTEAGGAAGVVADIAKLSVGREACFTRELAPPTTRRISLATVSPRAAGTAPVPPAWGWRAKHRWPGSRLCSKVATRRPASCSAAPMAAMPSPPLMWSCAHQSVSILYGLGGCGHRSGGAGRPSQRAGRGGQLPGRAPGRPPRTRWYPACVRPGAAGGRVDHRTSREGDPLVHTYLVVANRVQGPDGRWTALDGRDLCAPVRSTPKSTGSGRTGADTTAGQVGRPRHPQTQAARGVRYPVRPLAPGGGRAWRGPRHSGPGSDPPDT
jgi:hypothetical protein